ncbi:MAG: hypothetical protein GY899_15550 [Verrucomicrobiaceae bacterium]|nr:hypothetical protein [Verrucomicrobiaceae bacterium]
MMRRLWQWFFFTALVCSLALAALVFFEQPVVDFAVNLLEPWRGLCAAITPEQWQVQGNILLGLMWLFSGVIVYAAAIGMACVILLVFVEKICKRISWNNAKSEVTR